MGVALCAVKSRIVGLGRSRCEYSLVQQTVFHNRCCIFCKRNLAVALLRFFALESSKLKVKPLPCFLKNGNLRGEGTQRRGEGWCVFLLSLRASPCETKC